MMSNQINIEEVVSHYNNYISKIPNGCIYIINEFKNGDVLNAMKAIADLSEGIDWLFKAKNFLTSKSYNIEFNENELHQILQEVNKFLEKEDYYTVAEVFEYEVLEFFKQLPTIKIAN